MNAAGHRYVVLDMLGSGTFGQVVSCYSETEGKAVAVKVRQQLPLSHTAAQPQQQQQQHPPMGHCSTMLHVH